MKKYPTVTIRIDEGSIRQLDELAQEHNQTRSKYIKEILDSHIQSMQGRSDND